MSLFIRIDLSPAAQPFNAVAAACPVNIFVVDDRRVRVVEDRQDECTLCELCLQAFPGKVKVKKLYE